MQNSLSRYLLIGKRWLWLLVLGIVVCGSSTYVATKLMRPTYQAATYLILTVGTSQSAYDNATAALELQSTYSQLITKPEVLEPVASKYHFTLEQLTAMVAVKPQSNSQIIEVNVTHSDPQLAMQIANDIAQSLTQFSITRLNGIVQINILPAIVPTIPIRPKPLIDSLLGALVGLGLTLALIIVFEWLDDRINTPEDVQRLLGVETLAIIPALSSDQQTKDVEETPALAEGCRILSATVSAQHRQHPCKLIMVTSALAKEGKSTMAANLASFLAQSGKRVLLVDADLRHPALDRHFQVDNRKGFANIFFETWTQVELDGQATEIASLRVLPAGMLPANPAELLQSPLAQRLLQHFRDISDFDHIIFDTPPILPVADAQILASYIDATILVGDISKTPRKLFAQAIHILRKRGTNVVGMVLNKSQWSNYGDIRDYLNNLQQERPKAHLPILPANEVIRPATNGNDKSLDVNTLIMPIPHQPHDDN
ncbi:capsular exopolysaccharide biosynthesis protein [Reticulibacter mediterranei]|uniref:Capsular exopolysaccharide biosynthesis protein n=1 Tax=Reticulibacter mediterranei TaxID=2778369 RepID=A0A8J3IHQ9_9CHLR|nr:polysaccharide biosynthesis tyrosine autokinase [Reticulibacter mediterranei]GHO91677.1 capsular exopolysaccharide biosynthesis protein [Reticulibacter mediterranei]